MDEDLMGSRNTIASITPSSISHSYKPTMAEEMESIISSWSTPLHTAASEGRCDQLNLLLEYPELDINIQTKIYNEFLGVIELDNTPLHLAAQNGRDLQYNFVNKNTRDGQILFVLSRIRFNRSNLHVFWSVGVKYLFVLSGVSY